MPLFFNLGVKFIYLVTEELPTLDAVLILSFMVCLELTLGLEAFTASRMSALVYHFVGLPHMPFPQVKSLKI